MSNMTDAQMIAALKEENSRKQEAIKNALIDMNKGDYDSAEHELRCVFPAPWIPTRKK